MRREVVQRCPAVPAAPNKQPTKAMLRSASLEIIIALFPPSSKRLLPNLAATAVESSLPIFVEPVAENKGILRSWLIQSPIFLSPIIRLSTPSGTLFFCSTSATICWQARAQRGTLLDG